MADISKVKLPGSDTIYDIKDATARSGLANIAYGSCSTAAATAAKTVAAEGFTLTTGARITVKFTITNTANNPTLNVNSTGAKAIYYKGAAITKGYLAANKIYEFIYNGTQYELVGDIDTNTNTNVTTSPATYGTIYITGKFSNANNNNGTEVLNSNVTIDAGAGKIKTNATVSTDDNSVVTTKGYVDSLIGESVSGVTGAMHFKGTVTSVPTSSSLYLNGSETATTMQEGDVVIYDSKEYVFDGTNWHELGDESHHIPVVTGASGKVPKFTSTGILASTGYELNKTVPSNAVFTDVSVTSSDTHYTPATVSGQDKAASATGATAAWDIDVVKGVTLNTDGKGHVTGISVTSGKVPSNPNTDTKVTNTLGTTTKAYVTGTSSATTNTGTQYFDTGVYLENTAGNFHADGTINGAVPYGSCSTAAATAAKTVSVNGTFSLVTGARVVVKFTATNTAANPTLNVNSTGAKAIYYKGSAITAGYLTANKTYEFIYNGTQYDFIGDANTHPSIYIGPTYAPVNGSASNPYVSFDSTTGSYTGFRLIGDGATTVASDANHNITISSTDTNTTYTFTNGLSASGTTVSNSGVRSIATGTSNGTISVNTNGTAANVAVKGLGTAAYTAATNYVAKAGDTMTGALYVDATQTSLPNFTSYTDVRGIFGVRLSSSLTLPIIHAAGAGNSSAGAGFAVTGGGLTIIGGGENTPLGILHNAIAESGTTGAAGTALNPRAEEIVLASDNGVSIFTGGTTARPNAYIDNDGTYHGAIELAGARGLTTSIANGVTTIKKKWTKNSVNADTGVWQKIADGSLTGNNDINILFEVVDTLTHSHGILRLGCRVGTVSNVANTANLDITHAQGPRLSWVCRDKELNPEQFRLNYKQMVSGSTNTRGLWELQFYHHRKNYATVFTVLTEEGNNDNLPDYTLYEGVTASDISSGTTVVSTDVIPIGGTWDSTNNRTIDAPGITIGAYGKCTTSTEGNISIGGYAGRTTSATGSWAIAVGSGANSSGGNSLAVGNTVAASNNAATAVGYNNTASGAHATAVGSTNTAVGAAFGYNNTASNSYTNAIGMNNTASGSGSNAYGRNNTVSGENSYAVGGWNNVSGEKSVVLGTDNTTYSERIYVLGSNNSLNSVAGNGGLKKASYSIAIGKGNIIEPSGGGSSFEYGCAIGGSNTVRNPGMAIGCNNTINITTTPEESRRDFSIAIGSWNSCTQYNSYTLGYALQNNSNGAFVCGRQNNALTANTSFTSSSTGDVFAVGNGYSQADSSSETGYKHARSNAFRVTYAGAVYAKSAYHASGADYAEFVKEWWDGNPDNEDRVGYMVTIKDGKLHKANEGDYLIGVTSGNPSVVGNGDEEYFWKYARDEFNRPILEEVDDFIIETDDDGNERIKYTGNKVKRFKLQEGYDESLQDSYMERKDRPEWDYVGMRGIVPCRDDGTCEVGGFCKCGANGIATKADTRGFDTYYVIERINDHVISIEVK